jgi:TetR/AcrR family transcriptional regulator, transcriptional repressor for nem operon
MPWKTEHKEETRRQIINAAAEAFRAHGADGVGLADIMRRVGLTHGGFYAHFSSKEDLLVSALAELHEARMARFEEMASKAPGSALMGAANFYLSSRHREHPETGCSIATLGSEVARLQGPVRSRMSANIRAWLSRFAACAPTKNADRRRQQATAVFAAMIGGLILARAVEDSNESDQILSDVRTFLEDELTAC